MKTMAEADAFAARLQGRLPAGFIVKAQLYDYAREIGLAAMHPDRPGYCEYRFGPGRLDATERNLDLAAKEVLEQLGEPGA